MLGRALARPIGRPIGRAMAGFSGGFSPAVLFANNEPGVWYDPSDTSTLFSDTAGTTPATIGGTVALMLDKSGNDLHATQPTAASRPTLGRVPATGRRNLLTQTATLPTQSKTVTAAQHTLSFRGTGTVTLTDASTAGPLVGTGAGDIVSLTFTPTAGSLTLTVSGTVNDAQLELGAARSAYQLVADAGGFDVTEAGVASNNYLSFDGTDDWMEVNGLASLWSGTDLPVAVFTGFDTSKTGSTVLSASRSTTGTPLIEYATFGPTLSLNFPQKRDDAALLRNTTIPANTTTPKVYSSLDTGISTTVRTNGVAAAAIDTNVGVITLDRATIGASRRAGVVTNSLSGRVFQLIARGGSLPDTDVIGQVETYVADKTAGVTL